MAKPSSRRKKPPRGGSQSLSLNQICKLVSLATEPFNVVVEDPVHNTTLAIGAGTGITDKSLAKTGYPTVPPLGGTYRQFAVYGSITKPSSASFADYTVVAEQVLSDSMQPLRGASLNTAYSDTDGTWSVRVMLVSVTLPMDVWIGIKVEHKTAPKPHRIHCIRVTLTN